MCNKISQLHRRIENAAKKTGHWTKAQRDKESMGNVRLREEAAARRTAKIIRKVLKKQVRKARTEHLVKCCFEPGRRRPKNKPLTELYVKGILPKTGKNGKRNFKHIVKRCTPTWKKPKKNRKTEIEFFRKKGNQQFTEEGRNAEITVDLVLQARVSLSENKVNRPEDAIVSEMIKKLPMEKIYTFMRWFQERFMGMMESPSSWKVVKLVFFRKLGCSPVQKDQKLQSNIEVVCIMLRLEKEKEPEKWMKLHIGGLDGISCQHLQVMMTNVIQKHWEWQEEMSPLMKHGTVVRPTLYLASLDTKDGFR